MKIYKQTMLISKMYTIGAEIALTNDKESKPEEYAAYQGYRAACKTSVDAMLVGFKEELEAALA